MHAVTTLLVTTASLAVMVVAAPQGSPSTTASATATCTLLPCVSGNNFARPLRPSNSTSTSNTSMSSTSPSPITATSHTVTTTTVAITSCPPSLTYPPPGASYPTGGCPSAGPSYGAKGGKKNGLEEYQRKVWENTEDLVGA